MTPKYLYRFAELYERQGRSVGFLDNKLWVKYGRMIIPVGPAHWNYSISQEQAHQLLKRAPGSLMVRYTSIPKEPSVCEEWYAVICDNFKDLGEFNHKSRWEIKKGLKDCDIRQVDASFIAEYGYDVYLSAFSRYQNVIKPITTDNYKNMIKATVDFDDIYHYWGAFYKDKLIAYMVIILYGNEEVDISVGRFTPEYLRYRPSDALVYTVSQYYLQNKSMPYINSGSKTIHHKTNLQQYLLRKFPFKKSYQNIEATYNYFMEYYLKCSFPLRRLICKLNHDLETVYKFEEIRRKCALEVANYNSYKVNQK